MTILLNALSAFMLLAQTHAAAAQAHAKDLAARAVAGNADAALELAHAYDEGDGVPKDLAQAFTWFVKAAALGSREGQEQEGYRELMGIGTAANPAMALEAFRKATGSGSGYAAQEIGWMYENGRGVPQNDEMAVQWYQRAVQQGQTEACGSLGWLTENGRGTPKDDAQAAKLYYMGADAKDPVSQDNLGWLCVEGRGVTGKNYALAMTLFRESAAQGNARAEGNIGYLYEHGLGVAADPAQARHWLGLSSDHGDLKSQLYLGRTYLSGALGERDPGRAIHYSLLAAKQDSQQGLADLAFEISFANDPVPDNAKAAFPFLKASAEKHEALAFAPLGICYLRGIGTPADEAQARTWLMKAAQDPKLSGILFRPCQMLTTGRNGYPKDPDLAQDLIRAASTAGNANAQIQLAKMNPDPTKSLTELRALSDGGNAAASYELGLRYQNGDRVPLNAKEALVLFHSSASNGYPEAMYHLGVLYQAGILVKRDETQAAAWYEKAKAAGHPLADARFQPDGSLAPLVNPTASTQSFQIQTTTAK
ncbi:MAG TPA: tetratricopeptide repeat protein [Holophagaceae bacterium]|nr:tetratricopeptide repeat protein [Holophagaceae bacterium]